MRHRFFEAIINRSPQLFWLLKTKSFLADPWQRRIFPQHQWLLKVVKRLKPDSILEVGCGFGRNLKFLLDKGIRPGSLTGVDISPLLLKQIRLPKSVRIIQANVLQLPFSSNRFDLVFTHGLLMHVNPRKLNQALQELFRVTKKYLMIIEECRTRPQTLNYFTWAHDYEKIIKAYPGTVEEINTVKTLSIKCLLIKKSNTNIAGNLLRKH